MSRAGRLLLLFFAVASAPARAQDADHAAHQHGGPVPREILERPVALRQGIGAVHEAVTTTSSEAQAFYDQGLAYLHSYVWIEAIRSFHQALRVDPNLGMAYLGLTEAYLGLQDLATARSALQAAQARAPKMSERERVRLTIQEKELEHAEDEASDEKFYAYRRAIGNAIKRNPDDSWLWIQRGFADEATVYSRGQAGGPDTIAFYRTALALQPNNFAAHHYLSHSYENAGRTKEALAETAAYVRLAPVIPHAHHMHGHELLRDGRTEEAIQEFLETKKLEEDYYRMENIPPRYDWHHAHNLQLLAMSYESLGQMKAAEAAFREAFSVPAYTEFLDFNRKAWPEFLLLRGRFDEALAASRELAKSPSPMVRLAAHTLAGQALVGMGRANDAIDELHFAEREMESIPVNTLAALPYPGVLRADLLLGEKKTEEAEGLAKDIEKLAVALPGPDAWSAAHFELEAIAKTARGAGDWQLAEFTAQQMVQHDPHYAGGHFALGLAAKHRGDEASARQQFGEAEKLWSKADKDLPELAQIRDGLTASR
jgi:tetratricopeptide (TPR) repeat protein